MKKILLLGGSRYLIPVIDVCHKFKYYTITCDYLPDNAAHKYSDEYHNVSIIDKEAVLSLAEKLGVDGVMSFACDPGVTTAAYVAERMGLPFQCSYESASILQDKGRFRKFLWDNGFNCPHAKSYDDVNKAINDIDYFTWPVIVKPVDSAGSKGVTRVDYPNELRKAIETAIQGSHNGRFIIEDFITFCGYHSSADCFTVEGKLVFCTFSDQLFDDEADNPYTPAKIIWPSTMKTEHQKYLSNEIQRLMNLLGMRNGIYNIETCVGADGKPYIMEVSPRGGGCKIAEIQQLATGMDLISAEILSALGEKIPEFNTIEFDGVWCEYVIHNAIGEQGTFKELIIDSNVREKYVKVIDMTTQHGDYVEPFTGANKALGDMFLRFESREELDSVMDNVNDWMHIILE